MVMNHNRILKKAGAVFDNIPFLLLTFSEAKAGPGSFRLCPTALIGAGFLQRGRHRGPGLFRPQPLEREVPWQGGGIPI